MSKSTFSFNNNAMAVPCCSLSHPVHSTAKPWLVTVILTEKDLPSRFKANATFHPEIKILGVHWGETRCKLNIFMSCAFTVSDRRTQLSL